MLTWFCWAKGEARMALEMKNAKRTPSRRMMLNSISRWKQWRRGLGYYLKYSTITWTASFKAMQIALSIEHLNDFSLRYIYISVGFQSLSIVLHRAYDIFGSLLVSASFMFFFSSVRIPTLLDGEFVLGLGTTLPKLLTSHFSYWFD